MNQHDDTELNRDMDSNVSDGESHATTGGAAAAGAVTGGVIGLAGGPIGAAIGAVGGAIVGAASERIMHSDDDHERARAGFTNDHDKNPLIEDRSREGVGDPTRRTTPTDTTDLTGNRLQLREEELTVHKTPVQTGQVSVGKDIVSEQRTMDVPVTREEVVVERTPVGRRPADRPIDSSTDRGPAIDVPVHEDRVNVEKQAVVYEEVGIGKRQVTDTRQVSDSVRREQARVEHDGDLNVDRTDTPR